MATPRLPSLTKTWQLDVNNVAARDVSTIDNDRRTMFTIKDTLVNFAQSPWVVHSSSDSVTAGASDLWVDKDDIIWSTGNHSWIVLTKPTTGSQILISCDQALTSDLIISWSPGGLYTGGSISVDPTATDQVTLQASGNWNGGLTSYNSWVHVWHTTDGSRTRVLVTTDSADPTLFWILDEITPIPDNWALSPEVVCIFEGANAVNFGASGSLQAIPVTGNAAKSWDDTSEFNIGLFTLGHDSSAGGFGGTNFVSRNQMGQQGNTLNDDTPYPLAPLGIISEVTGFRGVHGIFDDLYVGHEDRVLGTTYPNSTIEKLWAQAGDLILPWTGDSTTPLFEPTVTQSVIADVSTNSNDGTPTNMENIDFVTDVPGGSFSTLSSLLDGSNEYVIVGDVAPVQFNRTDPFSISVWIKTSASSSTLIIVSKLDATSPFPGYEIFMDASTGGIGFHIINDTTTDKMRVDTTSTGWNNNMWHQIVATWDGDVAGGILGANIYIDGSPQTLNTIANTLTGSITSTTPLQFGARDGANLPWDGNLDDVAIYDKELTAGEVITIYNGGIPADLRTTGPTANLVGYWLMGEGVVLTSQTEAVVNGVLIGHGSILGAGATETFVMTGIDSGSPTQPFYHFWTVTAAPDPTGALAVGADAPPFGGPLINIYISSKYDVVV